MKKIFYLLALLISSLVFCQKITEQQAEKSNDFKIVSGFIKQNPNHPRTPEFKRKLLSMMSTEKSKDEQEKMAKPIVKKLDKEKLKDDVKNTNTGKTISSTAKSTGAKNNNVSDKDKRTAELLTHMFNNDPSRKEAYIQIINKSKCNLLIKVSGKKFYNLTVPANNQNFILVDKGNYILTTSICDVKYSSSKSIKTDVSITLNSPVMKKGK